MDEKILIKMKQVEDKFQKLEQRLSEPDLVSNQKEYMETARSHSELAGIVEVLRTYGKLNTELQDAEGLSAGGGEMAEMAQEEVTRLKAEIERIEKELKRMLIPRDPHDGKNVFVEIRAGTGGEEAALFAGDLFRLYSRFAEGQGWKVSVLDSNETELGGYREIIFQIIGREVYRHLKYEAGVHRVQRVPSTEASGRIHTSAVTVAVLPEVDDVEVNIQVSDLRIDVFCASGPGGQSVNTTYSAVRITHLPTGIAVQCQDERSQTKNKQKAMKVLQARLQQAQEEQQAKDMAADRKAQVGTGDRSEKIRTYNYPQNRVTDHRIGYSMYNLEAYMNGAIRDMIGKMEEAAQAEKLASE